MQSTKNQLKLGKLEHLENYVLLFENPPQKGGAVAWGIYRNPQKPIKLVGLSQQFVPQMYKFPGFWFLSSMKLEKLAKPGYIIVHLSDAVATHESTV